MARAWVTAQSITQTKPWRKNGVTRARGSLRARIAFELRKRPVWAITHC
jgi:hypothetical protein